MNTSIETPLFEAELSLWKRIIEKFIESCSHELKSPLCSIEGLLAIASKYSATPEVKECHTLISQCVYNMKKMLISLEEYTAHLQSDLEETEIQAEKMIERIMRENTELIQSTSLQSMLTIDQSQKWVSDEYCNYTILSNLINNAIVFSDLEKPVRTLDISLKVHADYVSVKIQDNGRGIGAEQQQQLFEPFNRGSTKQSSVGLGLFLVKGMVTKLGATISIESEEKVGTIVYLDIPNRIPRNQSRKA